MAEWLARRQPDPRPDDIAVVGAGLRLPGGIRDLDALWEVLRAGTDVITPVPPDRWDPAGDVPAQAGPRAAAATQGGFLGDIDRFDADCFGISPREARQMDPQQRLLLEVAHEAMEDAGRPRTAWRGSRTSVHVGILGSDYWLLHTKTAGIGGIDPYYASGKEFSFGAGRLAYVFGLHGPAMTVNTACSSSLVAVHLACQALRSGEADTALAGGVNAILTPELTAFMGQVQALSPTGRCRPFDARADGIVRGEGCGVVVLKRYADAVRDHDRMHALILGSAVNQDGDSAGLTVPSALAQQSLLRTALERAGLAPRDVCYVEAHGTGTPLGDPLELAALAEVYGTARDRRPPLLVGSHKANFGHMDSAAGIAGLLKTLLVLRHRTAPPQLHYDGPPAGSDWAAAGIAVPTDATRLPPPGAEAAAGPLTAGVSAFGLSGTNAHVLLREPPPAAPATPSGEARARPHTLLISATTAAGLRDLAGDYERHLATLPAAQLPATLATAALRRTHAGHRLAVTGRDAAALAGVLRHYREGTQDPAAAHGEAGAPAPRLVYVFSGQGSQWPGMGSDLYETEPVVRETLDECAELLRAHADWSLLDALRSTDPAVLHATEYAQPAVFALQVALARLWRRWGAAPDAVVGHSMGEVAAACTAGALGLPEAMRLIVHRGRVMQRAAGTGRMMAVELGAEEAAKRLTGHPEVGIATVNGPRSVVLAGPPAAVARAAAELRDSGADPVPLRVGHAFHTPLMRPYGEELRAALAGLSPREPDVTFLSATTPGQPATLDAAYWARNLTDPVLLWPAVDSLLQGSHGPHTVFLEIGAHPVLAAPLRAALVHRERPGTVAGSLVRGDHGPTCLARSRARLHTAGVPLDWTADHPVPRPPVSLPPPRWADERHWLPGVPRGRQAGAPAAATGPLRAEVRLFDAAGRLVGEATAAVSGGGEQTAAPPPAAPAAPPPAAVDPQRAGHAVRRALATVLGHDPGRRLPPGRGFFELGLDSVSAVELARLVAADLGMPLNAADVLSHATVEALTRHLTALPARPPHAAVQARPRPDAPPAHPSPATPDSGTEPIAVIGLGCRLPGGADDPDGFWRLLSADRDATGPVPAGRWDMAALGDSVVTGRGAFLRAVDGFDHAFFRVSPREARSMDPQQRLFLEVAWEALEDAGLPADRLRGSRTGVFVGLNTTDYQQMVTRRARDVDLYYGTGNSFSGTPGRLSYFLGLHGPSLAVDTACSSSLTAVHLACQSLRGGESETAVAGGANVMATPTVFQAMSAAGALAPDGRCKTFDDAADGYGRGEGAGAVVLKRLSDALRDGDHVHAVIRGSAVNQDGASGGLTVPSGAAQQEVIRAALAQAGVSAAEVGYVEAHGTGTRLGDAIELKALAAVLGAARPRERPLLVGSVKTRIGHLEAAAGIAGLIQVVLALSRERIPAHLNVSRLTRQVDWDSLPLRVATSPVPWPRGAEPRIAGVSAFGFTGTNAHLLLQEPPSAASAGTPAPAAVPAPPAPGGLVLTASATTAAALREAAARLSARVAATPREALPDLCWTAGARRTHHGHRLAVTGRDGAELAARLSAVAAGQDTDGAHIATAPVGEFRRLALAYGPAAPGLTWRELTDLAAADPDLAAAVGGLDQALHEALRCPPLAGWATAGPPPGLPPAAVVFAGQVAYTALLARLGIVPDIATGLGTGRLAAACARGDLDVAAAARLLPAWEPGSTGGFDVDGAEVVLDMATGQSYAPGVRVLPAPAAPGGLAALAALLHVHGCRVDFDSLLPGAHRVTALPCYPWQRRRHWIDPPPHEAGTPGAPPTAGPTAGPTADPAAAAAGQPPGGLAARLAPLAPQAREDVLIDALLGLASDVLGGSDDVGPDSGFFELGMDSVLSLELKRRAEHELGRELPTTVMFECPSARSFARFVLTEVLPAAGPEHPGPGQDAAAGAPDAPDDDLDQLSDDALLGRLLSAVTTSEAMLSEGDRP